MAQTYEELAKNTVAQLREIAKALDHEAVRGYTTMHKHELVLALCKALGLEDHVHHEVLGVDKAGIKAKIRELKKQRDAALETHDSRQLKIVRRRIKRLKRQIHKATV